MAAGCLVLSASSQAGTLSWNFSFAVNSRVNGSGASAIDLDTGSGVITTSDALSGGSYVIQGVSGMVNGNAITGLSLFGSADNLLLSPTTPDAFDFPWLRLHDRGRILQSVR